MRYTYLVKRYRNININGLDIITETHHRGNISTHVDFSEMELML